MPLEDRPRSCWIVDAAMETIVWSMNVIATAKIIAARIRLRDPPPLVLPVVPVLMVVPRLDRPSSVVGRRQVLHLLPGEAERDAVVEPGDLVERDGDLLASPQVPLAEQHVGHPAAGRVEAERAQLADVAVGGVHVIAVVLLDLARRDDVDGLPLRDPRDVAAPGDRLARPPPAGRKQLDRHGL